MEPRPWTIGIFVVAGLALLTGIVFLIGNRQQTFTKHIYFRTEFSNLSGIAPGAKVRVSGIDAGKVKEIAVPKTPAQKFGLNLEIAQSTRGMIRRDSVVSIETEGVVGDKFILIKRGSENAAEAEANTTLPSKEPVDLSAMMDRASGLLKDVNQTVNDARGRLNIALDTVTMTVNHADDLITDVRPQIKKVAQSTNQITDKLNGVVTEVSEGKGPVGLILKDEETKEQIQEVMANLQSTSRNLNDVSVQAGQIMDDFQSRDLIAKVQASLENVQQVSAQIQQAFDQDNFGENGASNLRATLSNLNRSTANLAEDTEALKHNFLFRGFFKKRGFFNVDQISPVEYLRASDRNKITGERKWLPAAGVFVPGPAGKEELSPSGLEQIDDQLGPLVKNLQAHVVIVEGYSAAGTPSEQHIVSRQRADLVRRYLEAHYHLRHTDVGIVALGNSLPKGSGRDSWDGAAILIPEAK